MVTSHSYVSLPEGTWVQSRNRGRNRHAFLSVCSGRRHQKPAFLGAQDWQICCIRFEIHGSMGDGMGFPVSFALSAIPHHMRYLSRIFYICQKQCKIFQIAAWMIWEHWERLVGLPRGIYQCTWSQHRRVRSLHASEGLVLWWWWTGVTSP